MRNKFITPLIIRIIMCAVVICCARFLSAGELKLKDNYRSPRNHERPFRKSTRLILLHTTEAHAKSSLNKLSERGEAHYCVTENGEVYRIIDRDREAFHAGRSMWCGKEDCDEYSVGIEVVGYHDKHMPLEQLAALRELIDRLKKIYNLRDSQVICHSHVAYGAPNTWHKNRHRGRKRCGMLFAMPSVRSILELKTRPAFDPDVRAKRLVQADSYLNSILYGNVDTMAMYYGRSPVSMAPAVSAKPVPKPATKAVPKPAPKAAPKPLPPKQVQAKPQPSAKTPPQKKPEPAPKKQDPAPKKPESAATSAVAKQVPPEGKKVIPTPKEVYVAKMGDDVRDLEALVKLPGYVRGGPVSLTLSPYKIAGAAWKSPTTYYYGPRGKITTGDKINEKSVEAGTFIFYKK